MRWGLVLSLLLLAAAIDAASFELHRRAHHRTRAAERNTACDTLKNTNCGKCVGNVVGDGKTTCVWCPSTKECLGVEGNTDGTPATPVPKQCEYTWRIARGAYDELHSLKSNFLPTCDGENDAAVANSGTFGIELEIGYKVVVVDFEKTIQEDTLKKKYGKHAKLWKTSTKLGAVEIEMSNSDNHLHSLEIVTEPFIATAAAKVETKKTMAELLDWSLKVLNYDPAGKPRPGIDDNVKVDVYIAEEGKNSVIPEIYGPTNKAPRFWIPDKLTGIDMSVHKGVHLARAQTKVNDKYQNAPFTGGSFQITASIPIDFLWTVLSTEAILKRLSVQRASIEGAVRAIADHPKTKDLDVKCKAWLATVLSYLKSWFATLVKEPVKKQENSQNLNKSQNQRKPQQVNQKYGFPKKDGFNAKDGIIMLLSRTNFASWLKHANCPKLDSELNIVELFDLASTSAKHKMYYEHMYKYGLSFKDTKDVFTFTNPDPTKKTENTANIVDWLENLAKQNNPTDILRRAHGSFSTADVQTRGKDAVSVVLEFRSADHFITGKGLASIEFAGSGYSWVKLGHCYHDYFAALQAKKTNPVFCEGA